jgi:ribosomal protein S18 acetylase RimI-like enzyme
VWWNQELDGPRIYSHFCHLLPAWRAQGIRRAMMRYSERRALESEACQNGGAASDSLLQAWASNLEHDWTNLLLDEGYEAVRYGFEMVRADLEDIPELSLPEGLEVRPVRPEHYRAIWEAEVEAFRDHWGATEPCEQDFEAWQNSPEFQPELWQVAWEGEQVAGMVRNFISHEENTEYDRLRGYAENISVRRPWRRRGLARALIARSLRLLKELGMAEAALGVDAQNPNGALRLYQSMGFREVKRGVTFRKPLG